MKDQLNRHVPNYQGKMKRLNPLGFALAGMMAMILPPCSIASGTTNFVDHDSSIAVSNEAVGCANPSGVSPLTKAAQAGDGTAVRSLLSAGAKVNMRDRNGDTALQHATMDGHARRVAILLGNGATANAQDHRGFTALHIAAMRGNLKVSKILIDHDVDGNNEDKAGSTPLVHIPPKLHTQLLVLFLAFQNIEIESAKRRMNQMEGRVDNAL